MGVSNFSAEPADGNSVRCVVGEDEWWIEEEAFFPLGAVLPQYKTQACVIRHPDCQQMSSPDGEVVHLSLAKTYDLATLSMKEIENVMASKDSLCVSYAEDGNESFFLLTDLSAK
ncbi:hypothetical protein [Streptomyces sp. NPDC126514]|uniref:hypothetical protein n=1 Tax=Streptomyces sp. NPDC126514 TaxID=3155210 RepID=UPI003323BA60